MFMKTITKKEELRILRKFTDAIYGENSDICHIIMARIIGINHYDSLSGLRKKYKEIFFENDLKIIVKNE